MTFPFVAAGARRGAWASHLAVGGIVPATDSTAGAVATQDRTRHKLASPHG